MRNLHVKPPDPPANLVDGLYTALQRDGKVCFVLARQGKAAAHVTLSPEKAGEMAANALGGAYDAYEGGVSGVVPLTKRNSESSPFVRITGLGVGPCPIEDHACLVVRVGAAEIGFALPKAKLKEYGRSLATSKILDQ